MSFLCSFFNFRYQRSCNKLWSSPFSLWYLMWLQSQWWRCRFLKTTLWLFLLRDTSSVNIFNNLLDIYIDDLNSTVSPLAPNWRDIARARDGFKINRKFTIGFLIFWGGNGLASLEFSSRLADVKTTFTACSTIMKWLQNLLWFCRVPKYEITRKAKLLQSLV